MHESRSDLVALQRLIDRSYATAGAHLLSIHAPARRLSAAQVAERLTGVCLLALATVTGDGRPLVGPVDAIFYRGAFHFGSAPDSLRFRHIRVRPQVSATHVPSEELAVTVHGRAAPIDIRSVEAAALGRRCSRSTSLVTDRSGSSSSTPDRSMRASTPSGCSPSA